MRKIISKKSEEKKRKRNQLLIGAILIVVMGLSTIGYSLSSGNKADSSNSIIYDKLTFTKSSGFWNVQLDNLALAFTYNPNEVEKTNSVLNSISTYSGKPLYVYTENTNAGTEVYRNLFYLNSIALRMQDACPENQICKEDVPVKTCSDNFIIIKAANESSIKQNQNCVFIYGKSENLVKLTDSFLYKITGIQ